MHSKPSKRIQPPLATTFLLQTTRHGSNRNRFSTRHIVPQTNNRAITMIHNLARSAAATQIQKRLRGILVRHIHWRGEEIHDIET
mmetsp:Transcript_568/g.875  ORF Transcript_568/g.875 Transcript_568/m.875 type:complete len:85 (+) Transcript_568:261-515(+)